MTDYSKDSYDYAHECMQNCSAFDDGYSKALKDANNILTSALSEKYIDGFTYTIITENINMLYK